MLKIGLEKFVSENYVGNSKNENSFHLNFG